jgi:hypothetical protein
LLLLKATFAPVPVPLPAAPASFIGHDPEQLDIIWSYLPGSSSYDQPKDDDRDLPYNL